MAGAARGKILDTVGVSDGDAVPVPQALHKRYTLVVRRLLGQAFPNPPYPDFLPKLEAGIVQKLCLCRAADPEPQIQKIIHLAQLMVRQNDGLRATEELVAAVRRDVEPLLQKGFRNRAEVWENIRNELVGRLFHSPSEAARAAETVAYATTIARRLVIDQIRKESNQPKRAEPRKGEGGKFNDPLDDIPDPSPPKPIPEPPGAGAALARLQLGIRQLPFRCPPNPPHQSLAWAYNTFLDCGPKKMMLEKLVDRPLDELLDRFLRKVQKQSLTGLEWGDVTRPLRVALGHAVGGVLHEPIHKRLYRQLLSRRCGSTCLRDYTPKGDEVESETGPGSPEMVLEGCLSDWTLKVNGRMRHEIVQFLYDPPDQAEGQSGTGAPDD